MKKYVLGMAFLVGALSFMSCNDIDILSPPGPEGPQGKSAYEVWVDAVNDGVIEWDEETDLPNYFKYLKGEPGESAYATWVEYISSGDVDDPHNPGKYWDPDAKNLIDFYRYLTGAKGDDGLTPFINADGNWQIDTIDTGIAARGDTVRIGTDGTWFINDVDTTIPATGQSAYQIWKEEVEDVNGEIKDPNGDKWPTGESSLQQFWYYLQGKDYEGNDPVPAVVERTFLRFDSSKRSGDFEEFTFTTESGATVTINHEKETVTAVAGANGICIINFPNSETREFYAVAYAQADGKLVSYPVSVRVPIRAPYYKLEVDFENIEWYNQENRQLLDNDAEQYGYATEITDEDGETIPYIVIYGRSAPPKYILIHFTSAYLTKVIVEEISGLGQFYVSVIPDTPDDYSSGYVKIVPTSYGTAIGDTDIVITGITNQFIYTAMIKFRASNTI